MTTNHEQSDISVKAVAASALVLAAVVGLVLAVVAAWLHPAGYHVLVPGVHPPEPVLQAHAKEDLAKLRAGEEAALNSYGWVDRKTGIVRIPIERAMELTVERGLGGKKEVAP
jgi:hypothetical protein